MSTPTLTIPRFTQENHDVRKRMFAKQIERIEQSNHIHPLFMQWLQSEIVSHDKIPDPQQVSDVLTEHHGRFLVDAENPYLSQQQRFDHLIEKRFPVTDYIRPLQDIEYTPLPDLFHEYFGHMPQMMIPGIADIEYKTAQLYHQLEQQEHRDQLFSLSWYSIEYGAVMHKGIPKAIGAGILSSPGDLQRFTQQDFALVPADMDVIIHTAPSPHKPHERLFVFDDLQQFDTILDEFIERVG